MALPRIAPYDDPAFAPLRVRYLAALPPGLGAAGQRLLRRIATLNWLVEWNLPLWLGAAFDLPPATTGELILGNIYGLAYVRLQDDLFDNEAGSRRREAAGLTRQLHSLWLAQYRPLFERQSPFWQHLDTYTGQWLRATLEQDGPSPDDLHSGQDAPMFWLAGRGAPLKTCCAAAGLLAGRQAQLPLLLAGVDHLLAGAVLVDHAADWQADLAAGRYNALVAFVSPQRAAAQDPQAARRAVLEALYLGTAARPYFELAQQQFRRAGECIQGLGMAGLEAYLAWAESETGAHHTRLAQSHAHRLQMATADLLRSTLNVDVS